MKDKEYNKIVKIGTDSPIYNRSVGSLSFDTRHWVAVGLLTGQFQADASNARQSCHLPFAATEQTLFQIYFRSLSFSLSFSPLTL